MSILTTNNIKEIQQINLNNPLSPWFHLISYQTFAIQQRQKQSSISNHNSMHNHNHSNCQYFFLNVQSRQGRVQGNKTRARHRESRCQQKGSQGARQRDVVSNEARRRIVGGVETIGNTSRKARGGGNNRRRARRSVTCCDPVSSPLRSRLNVASRCCLLSCSHGVRLRYEGTRQK